MLTKTEWLIEWTNIVNCNGYLYDWKNDAISLQWFTFLNVSQNRWATNLLQEDQSFNHSIICFWLLSLMKVRLIDWLTYCVNQRIKESTNTWMDKRCSLYAVNNNYKIIITNKLVFCYKDIVYSSFFLSIICFCFYLMNAWLRYWINAYSVCHYLSRSSKQLDK